MGPILFCAATPRELQAAESHVPAARKAACHFSVTGVGIPLTLARLVPLLASLRPRLVVNLGIAGAYPGAGLEVGDLVAGESEVFGDLGLELPGPEAFQPLAGLHWADAEYRQPLLLTAEPFPGLRRGRGCTVNACTGRRETGERRRVLSGADFETMEGAAAALAGSLAGIPVAEVRAISNPASDRDMRPERIELALHNLGVYLSGRLREWP